MGISLLFFGCFLFAFVLMTGRYMDAERGLPASFSRFVRALDGVKPWHLFVVAGMIFLIANETPPRTFLLGSVLLLLLLFLYVRAWLREFFFLMDLTDDAFPGRFDKLTWALVLILLGPLGLWAFRRYHAVQWPESFVERFSEKPAMPRDWA